MKKNIKKYNAGPLLENLIITINFQQQLVSRRAGRRHLSRRRGSTRSRQGGEDFISGVLLIPFNYREAVVRFEAKEEEEQIHSSAAPALVKEAEPVVAKNEVKEAREAVVEVEEAKEEIEEAEQEEKRKKEGRRRRKKHGSEDPEEGTGGHRVVICDDQVF